MGESPVQQPPRGWRSSPSEKKTLREFRARQMARLLRLREELVSKYPDKEKRINEIVDLLAVKLHNLRRYTFNDYIFTLYQASKEFREFSELVPSPEEVEELLEGEE